MRRRATSYRLVVGNFEEAALKFYPHHAALSAADPRAAGLLSQLLTFRRVRAVTSRARASTCDLSGALLMRASGPLLPNPLRLRCRGLKRRHECLLGAAAGARLG